VLGAFANRLAARYPQRAHAVLKANPDGSFRASVRAPLDSPHGADALCRRFGGGGRAGAAGFERLPAGELDRFLVEFTQAAWKPDSRA
jgi:nanoRNase/pAp phosphatase (c-di-AMP/oligoRNAs hydrolase)